MKECYVLHERLFDYIEGKLSEKDKNEVEQHIIKCKSAREQHFYIKSNMLLLNNDKINEVSNSFTENVLNKLEINPKPSSNTSSRLLIRSVSFAAMISGIIFGVYLGNRVQDLKTNTSLSTDNQSYSLLADIEQEQLEANWDSTQE